MTSERPNLTTQRACVEAGHFNIEVFERAMEIMAHWLAEFREEGSEPTENDKLTAGHLTGALMANDLLVEKLPAKVS